MEFLTGLGNTIARLPQNLSDRWLVLRAQKGDSQAFGQLYLKYLDKIYRYVYFRVRCQREEAEDLTEQIFYRAWEGLEKFDFKKGTFQAWLYRIAHNLVIDHHRQAAKKKEMPLQVDFPDGSDLLGDLKSEEKRQALTTALGKLSGDQQQVIILKFIEEMSNSDISLIMNKKEEAVRALQSRALKRLRKLLI